MGGSGLTGTLATLLGNPPHCPSARQVKSHKPTSSPWPTTSSSRIRHHSSAAAVALCLSATSTLSSESYHPPSVLASDHNYFVFVQAELLLVVENNAYQRTAPTVHTTLSLSPRISACLLKRRERLALLFATHSQAASNGWELKQLENEERTGPAERN